METALERVPPNRYYIEPCEDGSARCNFPYCTCGHKPTQDMANLSMHVDLAIDAYITPQLPNHCGEESEEVCEAQASWGESTIILLEPASGGVHGSSVGGPPTASTWCVAQWVPQALTEFLAGNLHIITRRFRSRNQLFREILLGELGPSLTMFRERTTKKDGISVAVFIRPHESVLSNGGFVCTPWVLAQNIGFGELCSVKDFCCVCEVAFGECLRGVFFSAHTQFEAASSSSSSATAVVKPSSAPPVSFSEAVALDVDTLLMLATFRHTGKHSKTGCNNSEVKSGNDDGNGDDDASSGGGGHKRTATHARAVTLQKRIASSSSLPFCTGDCSCILKGNVFSSMDLLILLVGATKRMCPLMEALSSGLSSYAYATSIGAERAADVMPLLAEGKNVFIVGIDIGNVGTPASKKSAAKLLDAIRSSVPYLPAVYGTMFVTNSQSALDEYCSDPTISKHCPVKGIHVKRVDPRSWAPLLVYNLYAAIDEVKCINKSSKRPPSGNNDELESGGISVGDNGSDGGSDENDNSGVNHGKKGKEEEEEVPPHKKAKVPVFSDDDLPLSANFREVPVLHMSIYWDVDFEHNVMTGIIAYKTKDLTPNGADKLVLDQSSLVFDSVQVAMGGDGRGMYSPATYTTTPYSITVQRPQDAERFPQWVRIHFRTSPKGLSVIWRPDADGNPCVFTGASPLNNRSIMPCQDAPAAVVTYDAIVRVPAGCRVLMSAPEARAPELVSGKAQYYFCMRSALPPSTLTIAAGVFDEATIVGMSVPGAIYAPSTQLSAAASTFGPIVPQVLSALEGMLGPFPFERADVAVMPPSFLPLGLQNPNITFLSHSMIAPDGSMAVRVAHEFAHSYFGLLISEADWYEQWLSEGFADYVSERVFFRCRGLSPKAQEDLARVGSLIRYRTLVNDFRNTDEAAHKLSAPGKTSDDVIKGCLSPVFNNIQYNMGYFLLRYLALSVGVDRFDAFLHLYVDHFRNKLLSGRDALDFFFEVFPDVRTPAFCTETVQRWLVNTCLDPEQDSVIRALCRCSAKDNPYLEAVELELKRLLQANALYLARSRRAALQLCRTIGSSVATWLPVQVILFLQMVNEREDLRLSLPVMKELDCAAGFSLRCADIRHGWCEIVVKNRYTHWYGTVERLLVEDQSMGLFIFGELLNGGVKERRLALNVYNKVKDTQDPQIHSSMVKLLKGYGLL